MTPLHEGPDERKRNRAFNTPEHAAKAVETGKASIASLTPGRVWTHRAPRGEFEIKGCLMYEKKPVAVLNFNPADGSLLPKGLHGLSDAQPGVIEKVSESLPSLKAELSILEGAEFREPEFCWAIPLAHQGRIVGHLKVSADGTQLVADKKTVDDLAKL